MTNFNVGDKVKNMSDREGKILTITDSLASVDYGRGSEITSLKYLTLMKAAPIPRWQQQVTAITANLPSVDSELLSETIARVSDVRIICPARLEDDARRLFDREGVDYPENWRGTELGKRGGHTEQGGLSATVKIPRALLSDGLTLAMEATMGAKMRDGFVIFNDFDYTLKLLADGRNVGWRITHSV
jgi:hypothetical protein